MTTTEKGVGAIALKGGGTQLDWEKLSTLYKESEDAIKIIEQLWDALDTTAINQLRYAGHHILNAVSTMAPEVAQENYQQAVRHCKRGMYDAYDGGIIYYLEEIQDFKKDYRQISIVADFPEYNKVLEMARNAQALIDAARNQHATREEFYQQAESHCGNLKGCVDRLDVAREELNKSMSRHNKRMTFAYITLFLAAGALHVPIAKAWSYVAEMF